jgi:hypothetical protein
MAEVRATAAERVTAAVLACVAWFALGLQLYLMIATAPAGGSTALVRVVNYFSFFTILTNLLVALVLTVPLVAAETAWGRFFASAAMRAGTAVYIAIVGATYSLLLRQLWNPASAGKLADVLLHDAVPLFYVVYWLIFAPKAGLRWKNALLWLMYPMAYMLYTLVRGVITGWYPYHFIDAGVLGFPCALGNAAGLLLVFFVVGLLAVAVGRWMSRGRTQYQ